MSRGGVAPACFRVVLHEGGAALRDAQFALTEFLRREGAGPRTVARAELLLEELALNALGHGFGPGQVPELSVAAWHDGTRCGLDLEDRGMAFDPTAAPLPDPPASLQAAPIGGLGVPLLRRIAVELAYERTADGRNRLHLVLPAEDAPIA